MNVYLIPRLRIQYTAFIMQNWVDNPESDGFPPTIFEGDDRTNAFGDAIFSRSDDRYRDRIGFTIIPTQIHDSDGIQDWFGGEVNPTVMYNKNDSLDGAGRLSAAAKADTIFPDTVLKMDTDVASTEDMTVTAQSRPGSRIVVVDIDSVAKNPLIHGPIDPAIDFHVTLTVDFTDPTHPKYSLSGSYDGFPCTELYINEQLVEWYDSTANGKTEYSLFGSGDVHVYKPPREFTP